MIITYTSNGIHISALIGGHLESRTYSGYTKKEAVSLFRYANRIVYLNMRTAHGVETVDELSASEFDTSSAYKAELNRLVSEYQIAGMNVYPSRRACANWN